MPEQIRVNIRHRVDNAAIRKEQRDGRDVWILPSAVAKFDTVLNGIFYPRDELEASYQGINRTPAPLGHPMINNQHVSARDPEAINRYHIGAHNENARIQGDRIMADMVLDVEYAQRHPEGQRLLDAINSGKPISTSTGLYMEREEAPEGAEYDFVGRNYAWDHVATLLDEAPAIGTDAGVGLMVNSKGETTEVPVINSELTMEDEEFNSALTYAFEVLERKDKRSKYNSFVNRVSGFMASLMNPETQSQEAAGLQANHSDPKQEVTMTAEELQAALDKQAEALTAAFNAKLEEATKPLHEQIEANAAADKAKEEAEKAKLTAEVVNAKLATQEEAEALDVNALRIMARNAKTAAPLAPGMASNSADDSIYDTLPE